MDQTSVTTLVAALCLMCISGVLADDCAPYVDDKIKLQEAQTCVLSFCSGTCTYRYCSILPGAALDQTQFMCIVNNLYVIIGVSITVFIILICGIVSCVCRSLCMCCHSNSII